MSTRCRCLRAMSAIASDGECLAPSRYRVGSVASCGTFVAVLRVAALLNTLLTVRAVALSILNHPRCLLGCNVCTSSVFRRVSCRRACAILSRCTRAVQCVRPCTLSVVQAGTLGCQRTVVGVQRAEAVKPPRCSGARVAALPLLALPFAVPMHIAHTLCGASMPLASVCGVWAGGPAGGPCFPPP
jgi:hypothetical protein